MGRRFKDKRLYDRGGRFIWARVTDATKKIQRISTRCTDEQAASRFCDEWERRAADPSYRRAAEATVESAIRDWLAEQRRRRVSAATYSIAECKAGHFVRLWGADWPLLRIDNDLVLKFIDARESEGVKPLTVKKELGALKGILEWARFRGTFPRDLATVLPPRYSGRHKPRTRAPSHAEVVRLLGELDKRRGAHVAFIVATGARRGESFRARREDIDLPNLLVRIRGSKTDLATAAVPITGLTHPFVVYALEHAPGKGVLFDPWGKLSRDVHAACVRAGIDGVTPNDLRRSFGQWHRKAGVSAERVSLMLRHSTDTLAQTTYARIGAMDVADEIRAFAPVPDLYAATAPSDPNDPNTEPPVSPKPASPAEFESATYGLGNLGTSSESTRRSHGNKRAYERGHGLKIVREVYAFRRRALRWLTRPLPPPPDSNTDMLEPLRRVTCP